MGGRVCAFLKTVYTGTSSEVKVGEDRSKPFRVACGLRQGCILSPLLFSLYINSLVSKLKDTVKTGVLQEHPSVGYKCVNITPQ